MLSFLRPLGLRLPFVILGVVILYRAFKRPAKELSKKTK